MHLYTGSSVEFIADTTRNEIAGKLATSFFDHFRYKPSESEVRSWQNSLRSMATVLELGGLDSNGIIVEYQLPMTSKRLDCMITGRDSEGRDGALIVELKQWDHVGPSAIDGSVVTFLGGRNRDHLHPSSQAGRYQRYLLDVHTAFSEGDVALRSCSYLHNLRPENGQALYDEQFREIIEQWPMYSGSDVDDLASFAATNVGGGDRDGVVLDRILRGKYRPHRRLLEHTASVIRNEPVFVLLDEQQVAFDHVLTRVRALGLSDERSVFLIEGGPGTGKSLIAVNLLAELSAQGLNVQHATGSRAFTENLRKVVGSRAAAQFGYFNSFGTVESGDVDVLICDEAHRIRETSSSRWTKKAERSDVPQVEELVRAAKISVFFIDDKQIVRPGEVGSSTLIREASAREGAVLIEHELEAQFRCSGSDGYLQWVDNTLAVRRTPYVLWNGDDNFDFDIVDSPEELEALVRAKNTVGQTGRLTAGYCWRWSDPEDDGTLVNDVELDGWSMPWNAKPDSTRLAAGIPKANFWASDPGGVNQVGCVYTAQGFEYDYAGVIWGRDLVYRTDEGWVGQPEYSYDTQAKRGAKKSPARYTDLVRNTYRVLLTRGMKGCYVYFEDEETRAFVLSRTERT